MNSDDNFDKLKELLFVPLLGADQNNLVCIFECDNQTNYNVKEQNNKISISVLDMTDTVKWGTPIVDYYEIQDVDEFMNNVEPVKDKTEYKDIITQVFQTLSIELNSLLQEISQHSKALQTLQHIAEDISDDKQKMVIGSDKGGLFSAVFKSIGAKSNRHLSSSDISYITNVLVDEIMQNSNIDLDDDCQVQNLQEYLEAKIVEALPNNISLEDVDINTEDIIEEIRHIQGDDTEDVS